MSNLRQHSFEQAIAVSADLLEWTFKSIGLIPWSDFLLNPRHLRGSDFLMRWSQGRWSEDRVLQALNNTENFFAIPYGPSGVAPKDVREFELYFEQLDETGLDSVKRPDLLIFNQADKTAVHGWITELGGLERLPFTLESHPLMRAILECAVIAIECENSLWKAKNMPDYKKPLKPQKRLKGELGLAKSAVVPTVIIKDEDRERLRRWQSDNNIRIHVWHLFYDLAFGISFDDIEQLILKEKILPTDQIFQAGNGATAKKRIYKILYHFAYPLGESKSEPELQADFILDKNGHILPYVRFQGGEIVLASEALQQLAELANKS